MNETTLTEQRLTRIWGLAEQTGDWWECNAKCHEIAQVLAAEGVRDEVCAMFRTAAALALSRVYAIYENSKEAA